MMRAQRVREGESRAEMQIAKWTAEGTVKSLIDDNLSIMDYYFLKEMIPFIRPSIL